MGEVTLLRKWRQSDKTFTEIASGPLNYLAGWQEGLADKDCTHIGELQSVWVI